MTKTFKVLAVNDEKDFCECCGKSNLKRVVWIENTETNEIRHFGTVCAASPAKGFGIDKEIKGAVSTWENKLRGLWRAAGLAYRAAGGKYIQDKTQAATVLIAQDMALWMQFFKAAKESK